MSNWSSGRGALRDGALACFLTLPLLLGQVAAVSAQERSNRASAANTRPPQQAGAGSEEIDSEHMFGFTLGSDVGAAGEKEIEVDGIGRLGKRTGPYMAATTALEFKYSLTDDFRIAPSIAFSGHKISGVPGLEERRRFAFEGAGLEFKYRLLDREHAPFGLTIGVEPFWSRIDGTSGEPVHAYGGAVSVAVDKELLANRIYAAFNLLLEPEWSRARATGEWERGTTVGLAAAVTSRVHRGVFLGAEARYLRASEGIGFGAFAGEAFFVGPTLFAKLSEHWNMTAAWNMQVAGRTAGNPGALDLVNFERHEVRLRFGVGF